MVAARASLAQRLAGTVQIAIAGALGGAAIAFGWYLASFLLGPSGYETRNLHAVQISPLVIRPQGGANRVTIFSGGVVDAARRRETIESIPGVTGVAFGTPIPGRGGASTRTVEDPLDPTQQIEISNGTIDSRYIDMLGLRVLHGRGPSDSDVGVALVNQALARRLFGRDNVVGESLPFAERGGQRTDIIGVLADLSFEHPAAEAPPIVFMTSSANITSTLIESSLTAAELQRQLQALFDSGALEGGMNEDVQPLEVLRDNVIAPDLARGWLTIGTATLVVVLAAFGFYGTQRYLVAAGRREYAIRASLGAGPTALGRLVLRRGLMLSQPGLALGTLLAFILVAWLRDGFISEEVSPGIVTLAVVAGMSALMLLASLGPAMQAKRTQPAPLLRED
jgi:hypothetical protein